MDLCRCDRGRIRMRRKMGRLSSGARIIHLKDRRRGLFLALNCIAWQLEDGKCRGNMSQAGRRNASSIIKIVGGGGSMTVPFISGCWKELRIWKRKLLSLLLIERPHNFGKIPRRDRTASRAPKTCEFDDCLARMHEYKRRRGR